VIAALIILLSAASVAQIGAIVLGALAGLWLCPSDALPPSVHVEISVSRTVGLIAIGMFFVLLVSLPAVRNLSGSSAVALFDAFHRSGALVFGGGHIVLPLLREAFVTTGWLSDDAFLAGYCAAQAVPGPLFTFAAYLGAVAFPQQLAGAAIGLVGIVLPGILILLGALPFWDLVRTRARAQAMMRGVNAAVVGVLGAALYDPVWTATVHSPLDFGVVLVGFVLLVAWRTPPPVVVAFSAAAGGAMSLV
jgi:chromate transporter